MIHSTTLTRLSRQDDAEAISALMNHSLQPRGISVKVKINQGHLKILLEGSAIPNQKQLIPYISQKLAQIELQQPVEQIYLYGRKIGHKTADWVAVIEPSSLSADFRSPGLKGKSIPRVQPLPNIINIIETAEAPSPPALASEPISENTLMDRIWSNVSTIPDLRYAELELEVTDLLITLEASSDGHFSALAQKIKHALADIEIGPLKRVRLYRRNPKTQRSLPVYETWLKVPENAQLFQPYSHSRPTPSSKIEATESSLRLPKSDNRRLPQHQFRRLLILLPIFVGFAGVIWQFLTQFPLFSALSSALGFWGVAFTLLTFGILTLILLPLLRSRL